MFYLFNNIRDKEIFDSMVSYQKGTWIPDEIISKLINFAYDKKITGNIWHKYIIYSLIYNENPYSLYLENNKSNITIDDCAIDDLVDFYNLYRFSDYKIEKVYNLEYEVDDKPYLSMILDDLESRITDKKSFISEIVKFYQTKGIGHMALYKAFRVDDEGEIYPIKHVLDISFDDLIGCERQKAELKKNTENFISGKRYNNVLLYGDSGTGKSTSIKALLNEYFDKGLRIVEIYKHEMNRIPKIVYKLKSRPYFYIIYMDDLSFDESEIEYKYLKSVIEGGIEPKPNNVAIYATSNRKHLIKESIADNGGVFDDLHRAETEAEKLSLAYRFGLQLFYSSLSYDEFKNMVLELAKRAKLNISEKELLEEANKFQMTFGSLSGRCASQFISYISNKNK